MKRNRIIQIAIWGGLFISGCHSASSSMFYARAYPPTQNVQVFIDAPPAQEYDEIGKVWSSGSVLVSDQKYIEDMVEEAQKRGADGLIKVEEGTTQGTDAAGNYSPQKWAKAVMIKFKNTQ